MIEAISQINAHMAAIEGAFISGIGCGAFLGLLIGYVLGREVPPTHRK